MMNIVLQTQALRITANAHTGCLVWVCLGTLQVATRVSMHPASHTVGENQAHTLRNLNKIIQDYSSAGWGMLAIKMLTMCVCLHLQHLYAHNIRETN